MIFIDGKGMLRGNVGLALCSRPDLGRLINAGRNDACVIRRPGYTPYLVDMTGPCEEMPAIFRIPDLYCLIISSRGDTGVINRPCQGAQITGMTSIGNATGAALSRL